MRRIFVDLDGVVVDFEGHMAATGLTVDELKVAEGAYAAMPAIDGAIEAVRTLITMGFEVWVATKPPTGVHQAYGDKAKWVIENIPELKNRIIITHDKGLLGDKGDFLCDDRPHKANCESFKGTLLRFVDGFHWPQAIDFFTSIKNNIPNHIESYSDELVFASNMYHRLNVNVSFLRDEIEMIKRNIDDHGELPGALTLNVDTEGYLEEQLRCLERSLDDARKQLQKLLKAESNYPFTLTDDYPGIGDYPKWITEIFPYIQSFDAEGSILGGGGFTVSSPHCSHQCAVPHFINESFLQVWWPVAADIASPGYVVKVAEGYWNCVGLER